MTTVPDDPVSTPPEGEPSLDPGAPTPAEPSGDPEGDDPGAEPFTHSSKGTGTRWLAVAFCLAVVAIVAVVLVITAELT
jgi:hypothetical protein